MGARRPRSKCQQPAGPCLPWGALFLQLSPFPGLALCLPGHCRGRLRVRERDGSEKASESPGVSQQMLAQPQVWLPLHGESPLFHLPLLQAIACLAWRVTAGNQGLQKLGGAGEGGDQCLPQPPTSHCPVPTPHFNTSKATSAGWTLGAHNPAWPPQPSPLHLGGVSTQGHLALLTTLAAPPLLGSEAGGGLGLQMALPTALPPCLSHFCPAPPSPSITTRLPARRAKGTASPVHPPKGLRMLGRGS